MNPDPRFAALQILGRLESSDMTLDALMDEFHEKNHLALKRDRAFLQTLVYGVLRNRSRIDGIITHFSNIPLKKIAPDIRNILRLGIFQIVFLEKVPVSAAVNTSVNLSKKFAAPWTVRFVNAILRKVTAAPLPKAAGTAEEFSVPQWLFSRWSKRFGEEKTRLIGKAIGSIPPITLRTNTLKTSRNELLALLAGEVMTLSPTPWSPEGISLTAPRSAISDLPGFSDGFFQVQDEAAQLTARLLSPHPGETVLDACAGLGGKTGHMAQLMNNSGLIYATDRDARKLLRLDREMTRLGISIVETDRCDLAKETAHLKYRSFDRILIDAPCSGLGVIRRNPDTRWRVRPEDLKRLQKTQLTLLKTLSTLLKPSGVLLFAVCSTEPEENEQVIEKFLASAGHFRVDAIEKDAGFPEACISPDGCFKTYPNALSMDGFFAARLVRTA